MGEESRADKLTDTLRRRTPPAVVPLVSRLRLRQDLRSPAKLENARRHMRFLLEESAPEADVDAAALRYLTFNRWRIESKYLPARRMPPDPVEGVEHLAALRDGGVLNFMHLGNFERLGRAIAPHGLTIRMVMAAKYFDGTGNSFDIQHWRVASRDCVIVEAREGSAGLLARLRNGEVLALASDMPGQTPIRFVGRDLVGSFGAARLAYETDKPVVVVTSHPGPRRSTLFRLHEPLLPHDFPGPRELLDAMVRLHEPAVVAWPEAYEEPASKWGTPQQPSQSSTDGSGSAHLPSGSS